MRITAICSGGDWYDASVKHLVVNEGIKLEEEKELWNKWYNEQYVPKLESGNKIKFYGFDEWLIKEGKARETTEEELVEYWDY